VNRHHLSHPKYRADIDGLRAIAILSVVGFHAFPQWIKGGFIGVDIFFVISGFLISSIIFGNLEKNTFSFTEFYIRRIQRIFPALILVLVTSYVFGWYLLLPDEFMQLGKHIAGGAGFISNLVLWSEADYFDTASNAKPLLHLWSLGVEEQFYIFWPVLLGVVWRYRLNFLSITIFIALVSFAINIVIVASNPTADFYSPLSRFWELMIGGVLAYLALHKSHLLPQRTNAQSVIGLVLIITGILSVNKASEFPGWLALLPTIGTFLVISAQPTAWINRYLLSNRLLVNIGLISYPLYLWHWPILSFLRITESGTPPVGERIIAIAVAFTLAWITYVAVEKPVRFKIKGNWKIVLLCVLLTITGYVGFNTFQRDGLSFRMMKISPELTGFKPNIAKDWRLNQCFLEDTDKFSDICLENKKPLIFLWGDSHAAALYSGLKQMQSVFQFGIAQYTASGCKPLIGKFVPDEKYCKSINDSDLLIADRIKPEFVLLHANWSDLGDLPYLRLTINRLRSAGIKNVVLLGPDPIWDNELPRIIFSYYRKWHKRPPLRMKAYNADAVSAIDAALKRFSKAENIQYISSLDILCNQDGCLTRTGENSIDVMTMDSGHLTPQGAAYQARIILSQILTKKIQPSFQTDRRKLSIILK
jgi:peptidoglycan/LPS O-acetylase OafA/YrhL